MRLLFPLPSLAVVVFSMVSLRAQSTPENLIVNGGFEDFSPATNPWSNAFMQGPVENARILSVEGDIKDHNMPVSISAGDLNGDELPDIAMMDGNGVLRIYFNFGSPSEPKFKPGEFSSLFLNPRPTKVSVIKDKAGDKKPDPKKVTATQSDFAALLRDHQLRRVQRIALADMNHSGKLDLIIGNYGGELIHIPNTGSKSKPEFRNPAKLEEAIISTGTNPWGNVFSPCVVDWNRDGKNDILVGEGSYSANSVHILTSKRLGKLAFEEKDRSVLAYGMGLEQLCPSVVDFNGDGFDDLLVSERSGKIAVYLNSGQPWKPNEPLAFDSFVMGSKPDAATPPNDPAKKDPLEVINAKNLLSLGGACTISSADFNGDGLFDLIFGLTSGKVSMALNAGSPTAPLFPKRADIPIDDEVMPIFAPKEWGIDFGQSRGNFYGYLSAQKKNPDDPKESSLSAKAAVSPAEGQVCLHAGYDRDEASSAVQAALTNRSQGEISEIAQAPNVFSFNQKLKTKLKVGGKYVLTFKVRGNQVSNAVAEIVYSGSKLLKEGTEGDRGAVTGRSEASEERIESTPFVATASWIDVKKEFTVGWTNKNLTGLNEIKEASIRVSFTLAPGVGDAFFDDFKLVEKR